MSSRDRIGKSQERAERILEAALDVFSRNGYKNTSVDDIAVASQTSKGGVYFHFPNKQAIFLRLLDQLADLLLSRAERAMAAEPELTRRGDAALLAMIRTFAGHRTLTRLFLVEALGAGREFNLKMMEIHAAFAALITRHLNELVAAGLVAPIDTHIAGIAWFGGVNEVVRRWVLTGEPAKLEDTYPALRDLLRRSIGQPSTH
jgi:TetR/AcrR family transcriptional regulator, fatty acid metabolism regulator protein